MSSILKKFKKDKPFKYIRQNKSGEDGLACVAMMLNNLGIETDIKQLRRKYPAFTQENNIENIVALFSENKIELDVFYYSAPALKTLSLPCIIHWKMQRFVLLINVGFERYFIFDPADSRVEYNQEEFECYFCEIAISTLK